jgi:hypothetical protein
MISDEDICNKALNYLQVKPIQSLDEGSVEAVRCKSVYASVRDAVLRAHNWPFATFFEQPALITSQTVPGWAYLYTYPLKCLAVRKVFIDTASTDPDEIDHRQVVSPQTIKRAIATNIPDPWLEYTRQIVDPVFFDSLFAEALALKLAAEVGPVLTGNTTMSSQAMNLYVNAISEAKRITGQDKRTTKTKVSSYENVRGV